MLDIVTPDDAPPPGWRKRRNLDLENSRLLQNALPDENYNTKKTLKSSNYLALPRLPISQLTKFILIFNIFADPAINYVL